MWKRIIYRKREREREIEDRNREDSLSVMYFATCSLLLTNTDKLNFRLFGFPSLLRHCPQCSAQLC